MAFWIVYQGTTWKRARAGGYLWAPKRGELKTTRKYWSNMSLVKPGDLIFAGYDNALRAVAEATQSAYDAESPDPLDKRHWTGDGWRLDVKYADFPTSLPYADWVPAVLSEFPTTHSPFTRYGEPNQGYLYGLPNSAGQYILEQAYLLGMDPMAAASAAAPPPLGGDTERIALRSARLGQGKFRDDLMTLWNGKCPLSGVTHPRLLRASHIKPWSSSNNSERLDPANGLLLSVNYDAAFDSFLISFSDEGKVLLAQDFPSDVAHSVGIDINATITSLTRLNHPYLAEHRALMASRLLLESKAVVLEL